MNQYHTERREQSDLGLSSILFAKYTTKVRNQKREQMTIVVYDRKRVNYSTCAFLFVCFDTLHPRQQFFIHVSCLDRSSSVDLVLSNG